MMVIISEMRTAREVMGRSFPQAGPFVKSRINSNRAARLADAAGHMASTWRIQQGA